MIQKIFAVVPDSLSPGMVYAEAGSTYLAVWQKNPSDGAILAFEWFRWNLTVENADENILSVKTDSQLLSGQPIHLLLRVEETVLVPENYGLERLNRDYVYLQFGSEAIPVTYITASVQEEMKVISRIPTSLKNSFQQHLVLASLNPAWARVLGYTELSKAKENVVFTFFYPDSFTLLLYKSGQLHLITDKGFDTPETVLYSILNLMNQHDLSPLTTEVKIGGMIEAEAPVFKTLYQYITCLEINEPSAKVDESAFSGISAHMLLPFADYPL
jgi:hypothetical protein